MNAKLLLLRTVFVLAALPLARSAAAVPIQVLQHWHEQTTNSGFNITTGALWDDAAVGGVGVERILLDSLNVILWKAEPSDADHHEPGKNIGQSSDRAVFPNPGLDIDGNIYAQYRDGIFQRIASVDVGGASQTLLVKNGGPDDGKDFSIRVSIGGTLNYHLGQVATHKYTLQTTDFHLGSPTASVLQVSVSEPAVPLLLLLALALAGIAASVRSGWSRATCRRTIARSLWAPRRAHAVGPSAMRSPTERRAAGFSR